MKASRRYLFRLYGGGIGRLAPSAILNTLEREGKEEDNEIAALDSHGSARVFH